MVNLNKALGKEALEIRHLKYYREIVLLSLFKESYEEFKESHEEFKNKGQKSNTQEEGVKLLPQVSEEDLLNFLKGLKEPNALESIAKPIADALLEEIQRRKGSKEEGEGGELPLALCVYKEGRKFLVPLLVWVSLDSSEDTYTIRLLDLPQVNKHYVYSKDEEEAYLPLFREDELERLYPETLSVDENGIVSLPEKWEPFVDELLNTIKERFSEYKGSINFATHLGIVISPWITSLYEAYEKLIKWLKKSDEGKVSLELLKEFIAGSDPERQEKNMERELIESLLHSPKLTLYGQFNFNIAGNRVFGLNLEQRIFLNEMLNGNPNLIEALNGPPGTGKTTSLQTLAASLFVRSYLQKEKSPIMVGMSFTRQAKNNIIEGFRIEEKTEQENHKRIGVIARRFLRTKEGKPLHYGISLGYGDSEQDYNFYKSLYQELIGDVEGFLDGLKTLKDNQEVRNFLRVTFKENIERIGRFLNLFADVEYGKLEERLEEAIKLTYEALIDWHALRKDITECLNKLNPLEEEIKSLERKCDELKERLETLQVCEKNFEDYVKTLPFYVRWFSFFQMPSHLEGFLHSVSGLVDVPEGLYKIGDVRRFLISERTKTQGNLKRKEEELLKKKKSFEKLKGQIRGLNSLLDTLQRVYPLENFSAIKNALEKGPKEAYLELSHIIDNFCAFLLFNLVMRKCELDYWKKFTAQGVAYELSIKIKNILKSALKSYILSPGFEEVLSHIVEPLINNYLNLTEAVKEVEHRLLKKLAAVEEVFAETLEEAIEKIASNKKLKIKAESLNEILSLMRADKGENQEKASLYINSSKVILCYSSTAHALYNRFSKKEGPLVKFIDYLFVDEAGQVSPEAGAHATLLAKRIICVGDTMQLQPVYNITSNRDYAIYRRIVNPYISQEKFEKLPHNCSNGSLMKIAQERTSYNKQFMDLEPGLYLLEHRRCPKEIIEFCNINFYNGRLRPVESFEDRKKKGTILDCPWVFVHVKGKTKRLRGSRCNEEEAKCIKRIVEEFQKLRGERVKQELAVITPFREQERVLTYKLKDMIYKKQDKDKNEDKLVVGTIHKLQGAERKIIIFSTVYDREHRDKNVFMDKHMLNVLVSRAKESIIVVGDMEFLSGTKNALVSSLYHYSRGENFFREFSNCEEAIAYIRSVFS